MRRCQVCNRKMGDGESSTALTCSTCGSRRTREAWRQEIEAMVKKLEPAEVFPLCEYLREELQARGMSQEQFANVAAMTPQRAAELLDNPETILLMSEAERIGRAWDMSAVVFLRLQLAYRKRKTS